MKNLLVLGDSYALLDEKHGHWASMWADINNISVTHMGYPGAGHVHIINKFLADPIFIEKYDTIFYSVTDFLRADVPAVKDKKDNIETYYNRLRKKQIGKSLSDISDRELAHASPSLLNSLETISQEDLAQYANLLNYTNEQVKERINIQIKNIKGFYNSMLIEWISRANLFAVETLILKCREKDVNLVLVMWPGIQMHKDNFDGAQIFDCTTLNDDLERNNSTNHLTSSDHKKLLVKLSTEIMKENIKL